MIGFVKSAPNARARFSCGKENNCLSEGLYTKERFCYDKENQRCRQKCRLKIWGRQWWNVEKQQDI